MRDECWLRSSINIIICSWNNAFMVWLYYCNMIRPDGINLRSMFVEDIHIITLFENNAIFVNKHNIFNIYAAYIILLEHQIEQQGVYKILTRKSLQSQNYFPLFNSYSYWSLNWLFVSTCHRFDSIQFRILALKIQDFCIIF